MVLSSLKIVQGKGIATPLSRLCVLAIYPLPLGSTPTTPTLWRPAFVNKMQPSF